MQTFATRLKRHLTYVTVTVTNRPGGTPIGKSMPMLGQQGSCFWPLLIQQRVKLVSKDNKMAQSRSPKRDTSGAQKNPAPKCSGLDLLENIKTHSYEYTQTPGDEHLFLKALNQMRMEQMFTDLTVHVQDEEFACHRVVVAASSAYFKALFQHDPDQTASSTIVLDHLPACGFRAILDFMYTHRLSINMDNIIDVLECADFLQFRAIVEKCASILLQHITPSNCLSIHQVATSHLCQALAVETENFIAQKFYQIMKTEAFLRIGQSTLLEYLAHPGIAIDSEDSLFESLCNWIAYNIEDRKEAIPALLKHVHINSIDAYTFHEIIAKNKSILELFKDIENELENKKEDVFSRAKKSSSRPIEVLVVIPNGNSPSSLDGKKNDDILFYSPKEERWRILTQIPFPSRLLHATAVLDNEIYFTGGNEYNVVLDEVIKYTVDHKEPIGGGYSEPESNPGWTKLPSMNKCRSHHSSAAVAGHVYVVGGQELEVSRGVTLRSDAEVFDPSTLQWSLLPQRIGLAGIGRAALVPLDNKLYVIGGTMTYQDPRTSEEQRRVHLGAWSYDLQSKTWNDLDLGDSLETMKVAVSLGDCLTYQGLLILIDEDLRGKPMVVYNPVSGHLERFIRSHGHHRFGGYAMQGDRLFCTGGVAGMFKTHDLVHMQDFNDPEGTWKPISPLPQPLSHHACVNIYKKL